MEFIREDCIYARQSVDRKDSISIESQIDFCKYELKGGSCRVFKDKGYSGKNTDRPEFQKLLGEIRKGKVRRVIVYKLDRISRSILDFATMMPCELSIRSKILTLTMVFLLRLKMFPISWMKWSIFNARCFTDV